MGRMLDRTGNRYGMLTVLKLDHIEKTAWQNKYMWRCKCDCGNETVVDGGMLTIGDVKSCGCLRREIARSLLSKRQIFYKSLPRFESERDAIMYVYLISTDGKIFWKKDQREIKSHPHKSGYRYVSLFDAFTRKRKTYKVHRLVAMVHLPDYSADLQVNHKNGIRDDNRVENLEMVTGSENVKHAWKYLDINGERRKKIAQRNKVFSSIPVVKMKNGVVIERYGSIADAERSLGVSGSLLWYIKRHKPYKNNEWRYEKEVYSA